MSDSRDGLSQRTLVVSIVAGALILIVGLLFAPSQTGLGFGLIGIGAVSTIAAIVRLALGRRAPR